MTKIYIKYNKNLKNWVILINKKLFLTINLKKKSFNKINGKRTLSNNINIYILILKILRQYGFIKLI